MLKEQTPYKKSFDRGFGIGKESGIKLCLKEMNFILTDYINEEFKFLGEDKINDIVNKICNDMEQRFYESL